MVEYKKKSFQRGNIKQITNDSNNANSQGEMLSQNIGINKKKIWILHHSKCCRFLYRKIVYFGYNL